MRSTFSQETINEYAVDGIKEDPATSGNYEDGVKFQWTFPASWWNWLMGKATKILKGKRADNLSVFSEVKNAITESGQTPSASDEHQLHKSVVMTTKQKCAALDTLFPTYDPVEHSVDIPYGAFQGVRDGTN